MGTWWPWLLVAGAGALHGLHPASGWPLASACAWRGRDWRGAARAMVPLAAGHVGAVALFAAAVMFGTRVSPALVTGVVAAVLLATVAHWFSRHSMHHAVHRSMHRSVPPPAHSLLHHFVDRHAPPPRGRMPTLGLGLAAFLLAHLHGAGWLLLPALLPLCAADPGPHPTLGMDPRVTTTLAVVAVHTAAMVATAAPLAIGAALLARRRSNA